MSASSFVPSQGIEENKREDGGVASILCHCNDSRGNAIFARDSSRWHLVDDPSLICEKIPGSNPAMKEGFLYFSSLVFHQGDLEGFRAIAKEVREAIQEGSEVCEMYAGVGLLGLLSLLHHKKLKTEGRNDQGCKWLRCSRVQC